MFSEENTNDVKGRIMSAARELFISKGFRGTSVRDIAAASGTNVAMVSYYYRSKHKLFEKIFEEAFDILIRRVFIVLLSDKPIFEVIEDWISSYFEVLADYPQIPMFILNEINRNPEALTARIKNRNAHAVFIQVSEKFRAAADRGEIKRMPSLNLLLNVLSLCVFPFMFGKLATSVAGKTPNEYEEVIRSHRQYVQDFVVGALRP